MLARKSLSTILLGVTSVILSGNAAGQPTRIYIANDDHTDFMWTADETSYAAAFVGMLDFHLKLADETQNNPSAYRNRFNADGSYWLWNYEQRKTPAEFLRLIARIRDGTISAPLNTLVSCYGGQPVEAVLRGMYYSGRLERRHNLRFPLAVAMENQTLPLGLASLFAGAGAKYSWRGVCGCASRMNLAEFGNRPREIYWWAGHDGARVLLKWHSLVPPGNRQIGGYSEAFDPVAAVDFLDSNEAFLRRYRAAGTTEPYRVRAAFGFGWDALDRKTGQPYRPDPKNYPQVEHFHVIAENQSNERRQVIVSNERDFFEDFENEHGLTLDVQSLTYGNEWDLYSASMSETSSQVKRAVEKLRSAELLVALVSLHDREFMKPYIADRDRAFVNLGLYWEHNWTADGPIPRGQRAAWQARLASEIELYVNEIQMAAIARLGALIPSPERATRFFVLNPLGWQRTQHADFSFAKLPMADAAKLHVRDISTGLDVPHQFINLEGEIWLRILATDVPAAGYKVYEILPGQGTAATDDAATVSGAGNSTFGNDLVELIIDKDGAIRSFTDKSRGDIELAASIGDLGINDFSAKSDAGDPLQVENRGPVSITVQARSNAGLEHTTAITLYRASDRIDIRNELTANFGDVRHWAFSFAFDRPVVRTEEVGAINLNKLQSAGGDYADRLARYDYITVNHFADLTDGSNARGVTLSNADLAFARLGSSTIAELDTETPQLHLLAGGQVDGPKLGIPAQYGNSRFVHRFALRPHAEYDAAAAMRFSLEHQNPLVTGPLAHPSAGIFPEATYSMLNVEHPSVLLWTLKVHDDGIERGLVARFWNVSNEIAKTEVNFTPEIIEAYRATHIETDMEPVKLTGTRTISAEFARQQLQTYRLKPR